MPKRLFLIDAMAGIYRAHFALANQPLYTSKGENVTAVFGFTNNLLALLDREKPDLLACVYDSREPTFRHHIYKEYKATREKMPEELAAQLPRLDEVLEALRIPKVVLAGYEADDLIGTLAAMAAGEDLEVHMVTGDKDFLQLVRPGVFLYNNSKGVDNVRVIGPDDVEGEFGVPAGKVVDVLGLAGDTSDNVPGVPKIGPKTAIKFVQKYGSLEGVLAAAEEIGGKTGENLASHREEALLSKDLVTIRTNAPVGVVPAELAYGPWDTEEATALFTELEFRSLFRYLGIEPKSMEDRKEEVAYHAVTTVSALKRMMKELRKADRIAFDTETTSLDPVAADLVGLSFSARAGEAWYVSVNHFQFEGEVAPPEGGRPVEELEEAGRRLCDLLRPVLEEGPGKIAQHAKYDMLMLQRHGVQVAPLGFDTMLADYLLNPTQRSHSLDNLALNYLKIKKIETKELLGTGKKAITMERVPLKTVTGYACEDADVTLRLAHELEPRIEEAGLEDLLQEVELPLASVLMRMEARGIRLDVDFLGVMSEKLRVELERIEKACHELAGTEFNVASPRQLGAILFEELELPTSLSRKLKTGWSTDQSVLEKLAPLHELPRRILEHRELSKLLGTYVDTLPELVNERTGRLHTSYHQTVAATGRLSSSDPNLQNIPIRTELGAEIRRAFVAEEGWTLLSADYSQIELRMMAHLSGDEALREAFRGGEDIHSATAAKIFGVPLEKVEKEQRSASKAVNYGVLFGMREYGLSSRMGIPVEQAREFIEGYFGAFPRVKSFIDRLLDQARRDEVVTTLLGRRRPVPEINQSNQNVRQAAERVTIATAVQGSAADLIKLAMLRLDHDLEREELPFRMLLQVHDELVFEVPEGREEEAEAFIRPRMEGAMELEVPIVAECGWGPNWLEAH